MSTEPKTCPCGRPTVTAHHDHCAVCIRTAPPAKSVHSRCTLRAILPAVAFLQIQRSRCQPYPSLRTSPLHHLPRQRCIRG